ncbi:MAG: phosphatase PAP2 family protein [Spiroplasma sp.]|nr:phosphatase PAP2 family protein [Spiroplasma sp.]
MRKTKKNKNNLIFFTKKTSRAFFLIPLITIVVISVGLLIATGWYSIDYDIAKIFANGLNSEFGKYWSKFYDQLGNTELFIILLIYLTILLETWFLVKINQKNNNFKKNYWIVNSFYIIIIIGWITFQIIRILLMPYEDLGFGVGIDFSLLDSVKYKIMGAIFSFSYQSLLLGLGLYYVRYKLVKTKQILINQEWIKAVKGLSFLIITYLVIVILKGTTQRVYYFNVIFGDLLRARPDLQEYYLQSGLHYGYNNGNGWVDNIPWDKQYPWWKPIGSLRSDPNMPTFALPWDYAFPSGHINATFCIASGILLFLKNKNNEKINWKIKIAFIIWLIHILSMNFALMVEMLHWISDIAFTFIFSIMMIFVIHFSVNKIFKKK